jgi:hypothetical protein
MSSYVFVAYIEKRLELELMRRTELNGIAQASALGKIVDDLYHCAALVLPGTNNPKKYNAVVQTLIQFSLHMMQLWNEIMHMMQLWNEIMHKTSPSANAAVSALERVVARVYAFNQAIVSTDANYKAARSAAYAALASTLTMYYTKTLADTQDANMQDNFEMLMRSLFVMISGLNVELAAWAANVVNAYNKMQTHWNKLRPNGNALGRDEHSLRLSAAFLAAISAGNTVSQDPQDVNVVSGFYAIAAVYVAAQQASDAAYEKSAKDIMEEYDRNSEKTNLLIQTRFLSDLLSIARREKHVSLADKLNDGIKTILTEFLNAPVIVDEKVALIRPLLQKYGSDTVFVEHWPAILRAVPFFLPFAQQMLERRHTCISAQKTSVNDVMSDVNMDRMKTSVIESLRKGYSKTETTRSSDMDIDTLSTGASPTGRS